MQGREHIGFSIEEEIYAVDYWILLYGVTLHGYREDVCGSCGQVGTCGTSIFLRKNVERVVSTCSYAAKNNHTSNEVDLSVTRARASSDMPHARMSMPSKCNLCA